MKIIVLMFLLAPIFCFSNDKVLPKIKKIGAYTAVINYFPEDERGKLTIKKGDKIVYEHSEHAQYFFGVDSEDKDIYSGKSIIGNDEPSLVIAVLNGGVRCCNGLLIFGLGERFGKILDLDNGFAKEFNIRNLDGDKSMEIEFWEGMGHAGLTCSAEDPRGGRVVLKWKNNNYELAPSLMFQAGPSKKQIEKIKIKMNEEIDKKDNSYFSREFMQIMMDLSYTGHVDLALKMVEQAWSSSDFSFEEFRKTFLDGLNESKYWKDFSEALSKEKVLKNNCI